jgi:hypothetical protein
LFDILSPTGIQDLIQAYGLRVLFAVVMLESMAVPMPGETALVTAALYAGCWLDAPDWHSPGSDRCRQRVGDCRVIAALAAEIDGLGGHR